MLKNVVGLFGTCGDSKWREQVVIPALEKANIAYFNPVVPNWNEEAQRNEVEHVASDKVIIMAITGETTGIASMAELGWQALSASERAQNLIIFLEDMPNDVKDETGTSLRINKARALIRKYVAAQKCLGIFLVDSLQAAADKAIEILENT